MSTRFPPANLPSNMEDYRRALENTLAIAEDAQDNTGQVLSSMRQSIASNYGLGSTLPAGAGSLSTKVATNLQNDTSSPASAVTLQKSWTNLGTTLTVTSPAFTSNIMLAVAGTAWLSITGGDPGGNYSHWLRINLSGGMTGNKILSRANYSQLFFTASGVAPSTAITVRMQVWGFIRNPDNSFANGTIGTTSDRRLSTNMRAVLV